MNLDDEFSLITKTLTEKTLNLTSAIRAETKALSAYSYIRVLPDDFLLKSTVMTTDFKRNSSGRTRIYEYAPPPPPINALVSALSAIIWLTFAAMRLCLRSV